MSSSRNWSGRRVVVLGMLVVLGLCLWQVGIDVVQLANGANVWSGLLQFLSAAFHPAFFDQNPTLPDDVTPFFIRTLADLLRTIRYALIAMAMAVPLGLVLGLLTSTLWWPASASLARHRQGKIALRSVLHAVRWTSRSLIALMRSVHELIWAMLFLSAVGDAPITACCALALPFAGTLGKVFSELVEEQSKASSQAISHAGGSSMQSFFMATFPEVMPNILTYTAYRFECAMRSSAVLGFIGIETIGLTIQRSFDNLYYHEVWTSLYLLLFSIILIDRFSAWLRHRLHSIPSGSGEVTLSEKELRAIAPRDRWLRLCVGATLLGIVCAWILGPSITAGLGQGDRGERWSRFVTKMTPEPAKPETSIVELGDRITLLNDNRSEVVAWIWNLWLDPGQEALINTVTIATISIILAATTALIGLSWGSRALATSQPFGLLGVASRWKQHLWQVIGIGTRFGFVLSRAIPEYVLAFLLVKMLGPSAWPLIIAIAIHNAGVLGRLWGEVVENQNPTVPAQLILMGGGRLQSFATAVVPSAFNRFLLFFFYRWETCLREATILGMLGISSLGYYIALSRDFLRYDRMLFFVLIGAAVIFVGDLFSDWLRRKLREPNSVG